jgi:hypothetical protein
MKIAESHLRKIIAEEIKILREEAPVKAGKEQADTKGALDVKTIASTLGVDPGKFTEAVRAAKSGNRSSAHNALFGDVFVKLMEATPEDTVKVMNALKKVTGKEEDK